MKFEGRLFEPFQAAENAPNRFSAADLLAVSLLGVDVPILAACSILETEAGEFKTLLSKIPFGPIESLSGPSFEATLGELSPAYELWNLLRRNGDGQRKWGIGPTTASKIMARKRPYLIPIQDSRVDRITARAPHEDSWRCWWTELTSNPDLMARATELKHLTGLRQLSTLRILDVVLWMSAGPETDPAVLPAGD